VTIKSEVPTAVTMNSSAFYHVTRFSETSVNLYLSTRSVFSRIIISYRLKDRGCGDRFQAGTKDFSLRQISDRLWSPPSLLANGQRGLLLSIISGWNINLIIQFNMKNAWSCTANCPYLILAWCLNKELDTTLWKRGGSFETRWKWVVSFTLRPLYSWAIS
jgi:hypothetical protein